MTNQDMPLPKARKKKADSWSDTLKYWLTRDHYSTLLIHIGLMAGLFMIVLCLFFYVYLPTTTHHGETIRVPNLEDMHINEIGDFLKNKDLRFEILDTGYQQEKKPFVVLKQTPEAASAVKIGRKIYITVNAADPPMIEIPDIISFSIRSGIQQLQTAKLSPNTNYIKHSDKDVVLRIEVDGKDISKQALKDGYKVKQGTRIELFVGDGQRNNDFDMPNVIGRKFDEAEVYLNGIGLRLGQIHYEKAADKQPGTVLTQRPGPGRRVAPGTSIELWVTPYYDNEKSADKQP
ncbi:MAG: PASTA domain-containing protein [Bernardetiaceae bacterium]|nr:PASTA domain-containing protein [Bernardetiaceae bacterium]